MISARLCRVHTKSNRSQVLRSTKIRDNPYLLLRLRSFIYSLFVVVLPIQSIYHITTTIICTRDFPYKLHFHKKAQFFRTKTNSKYTEHRGLTIPTTPIDPRRREREKDKIGTKSSRYVSIYVCMRVVAPYHIETTTDNKQSIGTKQELEYLTMPPPFCSSIAIENIPTLSIPLLPPSFIILVH